MELEQGLLRSIHLTLPYLINVLNIFRNREIS